MTEAEFMASTDPAAMMQFIAGHNANRAEGIGGGAPVSARKLRLFACAVCRQPEVWSRLVDDVPCGRCSGRGGWVDTGFDCSDCSGTGRVNRSRRAVEVAEKFADGLATIQELGDSYAMANAAFRQACANPHIPGSTFDMELVYKCCAEIRDLVRNSGLPRWFSVSNKHAAFQADLLRHIVGNPWRPMRIPKYQAIPGESPERWADPRKAAKIYQEIGKPSWQTPLVLDLAQQLYDGRDVGPILHDALIDAGADPESELVRHFSPPIRPYAGITCGGQGTEDMDDYVVGYENHPKGCWAIDATINKE